MQKNVNLVSLILIRKTYKNGNIQKLSHIMRRRLKNFTFFPCMMMSILENKNQ
jgi:hypothetical protein